MLLCNGVESYKCNLIEALDTVTAQQLMGIVSRSGELAADAVSHKICAISRNNWDEISDDVNVRPITKFVESQLVVRYRNLQIEAQIQLYSHFNHLPSTRGMTGSVFEAYCQLCFQKGISLEIIPMVRLPDRQPKLTQKARSTKKRKMVDDVAEEGCGTRRPQWHSSHVKLPDELETLRMAALSQQVHLGVVPSYTCEYDTCKPLCVKSDVYYLPKQNNQVALDSFILHDNFLYIFQFTGGKQHGINEGLLSFFERCQRVPAHAYWHFIFVIPHDVGILKCPASPNKEILSLKIFSSIVPMMVE
jgi:hypothetical protein